MSEYITLGRACTLYFDGEITPYSLRAEAKRGFITFTRIGKKDFVTERDIQELCARKARASTITQRAKAMSSATGITTNGRVLALTSALKRKQG